MPLSVFASHDWGVDRVNHERVKKVTQQLRQRGMRVWFDETNMRGNVFDAMCRGIDACDVVLVFVTMQYIQKVRQTNESDHVRREFMYVAHRCPNKMLPIRFDSQLPKSWDGPVGMCLGSALYVDMTIVDGDAVERLLSAIQRHSGKTLWKCARTAHRRAPSLPPGIAQPSLPPGIAQPSPPPGVAQPSLKARVRLVREVYGVAGTENESSREAIDRIYEDVKNGSDLTFRARLEAVERELGL